MVETVDEFQFEQVLPFRLELQIVTLQHIKGLDAKHS